MSLKKTCLWNNKNGWKYPLVWLELQTNKSLMWTWTFASHVNPWTHPWFCRNITSCWFYDHDVFWQSAQYVNNKARARQLKWYFGHLNQPPQPPRCRPIMEQNCPSESVANTHQSEETQQQSGCQSPDSAVIHHNTHSHSDTPSKPASLSVCSRDISSNSLWFYFQVNCWLFHSSRQTSAGRTSLLPLVAAERIFQHVITLKHCSLLHSAS